MSAFLFRLGRSCARHPLRVLGVWLVAAFAVVSLPSGLGGEFNDSFRVPGVESQRAADILKGRFPSQGGQVTRIVFHTDDGRLDNTTRKATVEQTRRKLSTGHNVAGVTDPFAVQSAAVSADGTTTYVDVAYTVNKLTATQLNDATAAATITRAAGVQTEFTGVVAQVAQKPSSSELIGVGAAIIVLLIAFGSVVAMGLPIFTALLGLFIGVTSVGVLAAFTDVPKFSLIICAMVGLGVGIDYALFIVTRHRQQLHEGMSVEDSAGTANATAGLAVLFAGTTVVIAILGLFLAGLPAITAMGISVALVVVVAMLAAVTLLPGLLGLAGTKIDKLSIHRKNHVTKPVNETFSGRWAHHVGRHPVRYALASFAALCAFAVPMLSMRIGTADDGNAAKHTTQRKGYDALSKGFGQGFNGAIQVVIDIPTPADRVAVARVHDALQADPGVAAVTAPVSTAPVTLRR